MAFLSIGLLFSISTLLTVIIGQSQYIFVGQIKNPNQAQLYCQHTYNTSLATVTSIEENEYITSQCIPHDPGHDSSGCIIGLTYKRTSNTTGWQWFDGSININYYNWAPGQPNQEDCTAIWLQFNNYPAGVWNDRSCDGYGQHFFCNAPVPTLTHEFFRKKKPKRFPTYIPTIRPTISTSMQPTLSPITSNPTTVQPTINPTILPTIAPTHKPTRSPTYIPTIHPTINPSMQPTSNPSTVQPTNNPIKSPTVSPTYIPTIRPTRSPSMQPTLNPTISPTKNPSRRMRASTWQQQEVMQTETNEQYATYAPNILQIERSDENRPLVIGLLGGGFGALCCCVICIICYYLYSESEKKGRKYIKKPTSEVAIEIVPGKMGKEKNGRSELEQLKKIKTSFELHLINTNVASNILLNDIIDDMHKVSDDEGVIRSDAENFLVTPE